MLTAEGCAARRQRLLDLLKPFSPLLLGDPLHLRYFANLYVDPFSLGADYGALLLLNPDGETTLYYDHRLPKTYEAAHVAKKEAVKWYDGNTAGMGPRRGILVPIVAKLGGRVQDSLADPMAAQLFDIVGEMRRRKDADEVALLRTCCRAGEAGQAWARSNVRPGMTELEVYTGIFQACSLQAKQPVILYGDFAVSPGSAKRGGMPTQKVIQSGETLILDFSVVIGGYRSDYTNTLVVGAEPTAHQQRLFDLCVQSMAAGERAMKAGATCQSVYDATRAVFAEAGVADAFLHHAGHGLGLGHPEAPFFVKNSSETLVAGDVVTLEPGLYVDGVGGIRIEHNYLVTDSGFEQLSQHAIALK
jgi:Xaa-Pro dipeptidase